MYALWSCLSAIALASVGPIYLARPTPSEQVAGSPIAATLLESNSRYRFTDGVSRRGLSTIHRLDLATTRRVEIALRRAADRTKLPVNYLAAYVVQESTGDPRAEFRNSAQWDAAKDDRERFAATDHGLVQISGRNLLRQFPALSPVALKSKADEIDFAVDYLADYVVEDLGLGRSPGY